MSTWQDHFGFPVHTNTTFFFVFILNTLYIEPVNKVFVITRLLRSTMKMTHDLEMDL